MIASFGFASVAAVAFLNARRSNNSAEQSVLVVVGLSGLAVAGAFIAIVDSSDGLVLLAISTVVGAIGLGESAYYLSRDLRHRDGGTSRLAIRAIRQLAFGAVPSIVAIVGSIVLGIALLPEPGGSKAIANIAAVVCTTAALPSLAQVGLGATRVSTWALTAFVAAVLASIAFILGQVNLLQAACCWSVVTILGFALIARSAVNGANPPTDPRTTIRAAALSFSGIVLVVLVLSTWLLFERV